MKDIYPIKPVILPDYSNIWLIVVILLLIIILIIFLILKPKKTKITKPKNNISALVKRLENLNLNQNRIDFYSQIYDILIEILENKLKLSLKDLTWEEIENKFFYKNVWKYEKLFSILKEIYFKIYDENLEDSLEDRKKLLEEILSILTSN